MGCVTVILGSVNRGVAVSAFLFGLLELACHLFFVVEETFVVFEMFVLMRAQATLACKSAHVPHVERSFFLWDPVIFLQLVWSREQSFVISFSCSSSHHYRQHSKDWPLRRGGTFCTSW